jgi:hypothetical protein
MEQRLEFDPGPLDASDAAAVEEPSPCEAPLASFIWHSGEQGERAEDRQIITVNGYFSSEELVVEMSWARGEERGSWSDVSRGKALENWRTLVAQAVLPSEASLPSAMTSALTVVHTDGCSRFGLPVYAAPWRELTDTILAQQQSTLPAPTPASSVRSQVVLALELAPDIKSVQLHCQSGWKERTGVRDGRARFTEVPREECQAGWIGDRRGWVVIPGDAELLRCLFEEESVRCDPL